jgi:large subunit ribosomal protein L15
MKYHELTSTKKQSGRRVGRGIAAGQGKTAGRGTKGQGARSGWSKRPGFEGGQNPLMQRMPKLRGFRSFAVKTENVYTDQLAKVGAVVDNAVLAEKGLVSSEHAPVKLLFRGEVAKKVTVSLQGVSAKALEAVQEAGGTFNQIPRVKRPKTSTKTK